MRKTNKVILSVRVEPELREDILQEAQSFEMTTSGYLEYLLENRDDIIDKDEDYEAYLREEEEIFEAMEREIEEEDKKEREANSTNSGFDENYFPLLFFHDGQEQQFKEFLDNLWKSYPDLNKEELILASLYAAMKNEKSFWQYSIRDFKLV